MSDHCDILWVIRPNCYIDLGNGSKKFGNHWFILCRSRRHAVIT